MYGSSIRRRDEKKRKINFEKEYKDDLSKQLQTFLDLSG